MFVVGTDVGGALLSVDVHEKGHTPPDDVVLDLDALVEGTAKQQARRDSLSPQGRGLG